MFRNPQCDIAQVLENNPFAIGPAPLVCYPSDAHRVEVATVASSQLIVSRAPWPLNPLAHCLQIQVGIQRASVSLTGDNANCETWVLSNDEMLKALAWGTVNAQPLTISFDTQCDVPCNIAFSVHDFNNSVSALQVLNYPSAAPISRASLTFPPMTAGDYSQGMKLVINLGFPSGGTYGTSGPTGVMLSGAFFQINGADCLIDKSVGTNLRFTNFQADIGSTALLWRPISVVKSLQMCQQTLVKTHPQGVSVNLASPAGYSGSLGFFGSPDAAAGQLINWRFPIPMFGTPTLYTYSVGLPNDRKWFQANGGVPSGNPNVVGLSNVDAKIANPATGYPNGSSFYLQALVTSELGGNGLPMI